MLDFEVLSDIINLPSLLADRWKNVAKFKQAKNVSDVVNLIKSIMKNLDCYVDLHDLNFSFDDYDRVVNNFRDMLAKDTELLINGFALQVDKKIYRQDTNISNFFEAIYHEDESGFNHIIYHAGQVDVWLSLVDEIEVPHDTKVNLDSIYFMVTDIENFESKYKLSSNIETNKQDNKIAKTEVKEVIKEIEKPQPYLDKDHSNYSSRLAICLDIWNYLFVENNYDNKINIKENISRWNKKTNQQLKLSESLMNAMQSILNFDNGVDRTGKMLKGYTPEMQKK